jgi:hypothetical protein
MARFALSPNAYSHAPRQHPNLLIGSLQILVWLLGHPLAWCHHIARIDPALRPDCTFLDLEPAHWRHPLFRRLLLGYCVYALLIVITSGLLLWSFGRTGMVLAVGMLAPLLVSAVLLVVGGTSFNIAVGLALSAPGGLLFAVGYAVLGELGYPHTFTLQIAMLHMLMLGLGGGIAGYVASNIAIREAEYPISRWNRWSRRLSGILSGMAIGGTAVFATYSLLHAASVAVGETLIGISPIGLPLTLGLLAALLLLVMLTVEWKRAKAILLINLLMFGVTLAVFATLSNLNLFEAACIGFTLMFLGLISLPYATAERIVGPRAAAIAGTLGMGIGWTIWMILAVSMSFLSTFAPTFGCLLVGLTLVWWGPLLAHPFLEIWNLLLLRLDEQRNPEQPALLRWHAACWHQTHTLPFYNLEVHLVLIAERRPAEGNAAIVYLSTGNQRWAAQAAQIELCARQLERCAGINDIIAAYQSLAVGDLQSPVSALMRSFHRIGQSVKAAVGNTTIYHKRLAFGVVEENLDALLHEMTLSGDSYTLRFRPIAEHWRRLIAGYTRELTDAVEHSQELDNPYIFSVPLVEHQDLFVGRADIAARIEQLLLDRRRPPLLLYGQRRMGKTSLLRNLGRLLPSSTVLLFVDGEGIAGAGDYGDFLYGIATAMVRSAEQHRRLTLPLPTRALLLSSPFVYFNEWLDNVERALEVQGHTVALLALDEFEALETIADRGRFDERDVLRLLRNLVQHRPRFKVLLAGSHTLEEFRDWASYLINMQVVKVSYLEQADTIQLIEHPVEGFPLRYTPEARRHVVELTHCHPHLVQLLCYEIVELKNRRPAAIRHLVTLEDVEAAIPQALNTGDFFFSDMANQVGDGGMAILRLLAERGPYGAADHAELAGRGPIELEQALTLLLRRDIIELAEGRYRFQVELIRRWFAQFAPAPTERMVAGK